MGVRNIVFGSKEERKYYKKLMNSWGDRLNIYHNLPFLTIFTGRESLIDSENFTTFELNDQEYELLKKTSVDYVICDKRDQPLLCIDFDGMQGGFNIGKDYVVFGDKGTIKRRKDFFELKLKVAHGSLFPYFILGSDQFKSLSETQYITIADGLIGEIISTNARIKTFEIGFLPRKVGYSEEEFAGLSEITKKDLIEDWAIGIEIESDYKNNPIFQATARLMRETESTGYHIFFPNEDDPDKDIWVCVECEIINHKYGNDKAKMYLPNFKTPSCYLIVHLAQEIAKLIALEKIRKRMRIVI
jgi:hypothetical protein